MDPRAELEALDVLLEADAIWLQQLSQARTADAWDALLDPAWCPPGDAPTG